MSLPLFLILLGLILAVTVHVSLGVVLIVFGVLLLVVPIR